MLKFYDIDPHYVDFLKQFDHKVPNISYDTNNKFVCGAVLNIEDTQYFVPVSHNKQVFKTSLPIYDEDKIIATLRFSFMFPAPTDVLQEKKFELIKESDPQYASLLQKEWKYCNDHEDQIKRKADSVYKIGCNPHHRLNKNCCNFKLLEDKYKEYNKENIRQNINESTPLREKISKLNENKDVPKNKKEIDKELNI